MFTGELSPRICVALIEHLPFESAFKSALMCKGGYKDTGWDRNTFMLAEIVDSLQALHATFIRTKVKNPKSVKPPQQYRRPGTEDKKKSSYFADAFTSSPTAPGEKTFAIPAAILNRSAPSESPAVTGSEEPAPFTVR